MIIFILGLAMLYGTLIYMFPEYIVELTFIVASIEAFLIGLYIIIKNEVEKIVRKHRNILREELINDIKKLYKCKDLNNVIDWRLDR